MLNQNRPPAFMLFFFSIFGFIGIAVLIHLWTASGFGAPPLIFRVFGSFIALAFIAMGFGMPLTVLLNKNKNLPINLPRVDGSDPTSLDGSTPKPGTYDCPHCGANVGDGDVSPSGDLRCTYCNEWWNIHRR